MGARFAVRIAPQLGSRGITSVDHFGHAGKKRPQDSGHQRAKVLLVEVLVCCSKRVLLDQIAARENAERGSRSAATMPSDGSRLRDDTASGDPLPPAEVDVFQISKVIRIEPARGQEFAAANRHQPAAREQPFLARRRFGEVRDRAADVLLKSVPVESQESIGEVVLDAGGIDETAGDGGDVGRSVRQSRREPLRGVGLHRGVVVDEKEERCPRRLRAETAACGKSDVARGRDPAHRGMAPENLLHRESSGVVDEDRLEGPSRRRRFQGRKSFEQVLLALMVNDDNRGVRPGHSAKD